MSFQKLITSLYGPRPAPLMSIQPTGDSSKSSDADNYESTLRSLRTVEDVIIYFAKFGDSTLIKIVYCVVDPTLQRYNPYKVVVVRDITSKMTKQWVPRFYTVSKSGMMEHTGRGVCIHITLDSWIKYSAWFGLLTCLPFFDNYLIKKYMQRIRSRSGRNIFIRKQQFIKNRLLSMRDPFRSAYADFRSLITSKLACVDIPHNPTAPIDMHTWKGLQLKRVTDGLYEIQKIESELFDVSQSVSRVLEQPQPSSSRKSALERRLHGRMNKSTSVSALKMAVETLRLKERKTKIDIELNSNFHQLTKIIISDAMIDLRVRTLIQLGHLIECRTDSIILTVESTHKSELYISQGVEDINACITTMMHDIQERLIKSALMKFDGLVLKDYEARWFTDLVAHTCNVVSYKFQQVDLSSLKLIAEAQKYLDCIEPSSGRNITSLQQSIAIRDDLSCMKTSFASDIFHLDATSQTNVTLQRLDIVISETRAEVLATIKANVQASIALLQNITNDQLGSIESDGITSEVLLRKRQIDEDYRQLAELNVKIPNDDTFNYNFLNSKCQDLLVA